MWQEAELTLINYIPDELSPGMLFVSDINDVLTLYAIKKPIEITKDFIEKNGLPVKMYIVVNTEDLQLSEELTANSLFDFEKLDYYNPTSFKELNIILNECEGMLEVMLNEELTDYEKVDNNFIIKFLTD